MFESTRFPRLLLLIFSSGGYAGVVAGAFQAGESPPVAEAIEEATRANGCEPPGEWWQAQSASL